MLSEVRLNPNLAVPEIELMMKKKLNHLNCEDNQRCPCAHAHSRALACSLHESITLLAFTHFLTRRNTLQLLSTTVWQTYGAITTYSCYLHSTTVWQTYILYEALTINTMLFIGVDLPASQFRASMCVNEVAFSICFGID